MDWEGLKSPDDLNVIAGEGESCFQNTLFTIIQDLEHGVKSGLKPPTLESIFYH